MAAIFQVYKDKAGEFRFRLMATNGQTIAVSEGYKTKASAMRGINSIKLIAPDATINDWPVNESKEELSKMFSDMNFHPAIIRVSYRLFRDAHFAQAIFDAFKMVDLSVKEKSGLCLSGRNLMSTAFKETEPVLRLNELLSDSDKDEQEGFKFLYMGATVGIRNPKAHDVTVQTDTRLTLEYLAFTSLLMRKLESSNTVNPL